LAYHYFCQKYLLEANATFLQEKSSWDAPCGLDNMLIFFIAKVSFVQIEEA
jgi:hypothetical protein